MTTMLRADAATLRAALSEQKWPLVKQILLSLPTAPPAKASSSELAALLDTVHTAADSFTDACTFSSAFDTVYVARETLTKLGVPEWAAAALNAFQHVVSVTARLANVMSVVALSTNGRHHIGSIGAVDLLAKIWRNHQSSVQIVTCLASLCCGHIDNVSRVMRQRAISTAIHILNEERYMQNPDLLEKVLLLVGLCAICIPDNTDEGKDLVPAIITALERLNEARLPTVAVQAISALGNIGDCWLKESYGYEIMHPRRVINAVLATWTANPRSTPIAEAASRTLLVLSTAHPNAEEALFQCANQLRDVLIKRRKFDCIMQALFDRTADKGNLLSTEREASDIVPVHANCGQPKTDSADHAGNIFTQSGVPPLSVRPPGNLTPSNTELFGKPSIPSSKAVSRDTSIQCLLTGSTNENKLSPASELVDSDTIGGELPDIKDECMQSPETAEEPYCDQAEVLEPSVPRHPKVQAHAVDVAFSPNDLTLRRSARKRKLPAKFWDNPCLDRRVRRLNYQYEQDKPAAITVAESKKIVKSITEDREDDNQERDGPRLSKWAQRQNRSVSRYTSPCARRKFPPEIISLISDDEQTVVNPEGSRTRSGVEDGCETASETDVMETPLVHTRRNALMHDLMKGKRRMHMRQTKCIDN